MSAKPILFSAPMMRALADGSKTQTRRVVQPPPPSLEHARTEATSLWWDGRACPYGQPGDLLWVRETFGVVRSNGFGGWMSIIPRALPDGFEVAYRATDSDILSPGGWKPSIHMPRWASRYTLRLTDVRVERVQDISGVDAVAEGCAQGVPLCDLLHYGGYGKARHEFRDLWDSLNAARGFGWDANPWVWCLSFSVIARNVSEVLHET